MTADCENVADSRSSAGVAQRASISLILASLGYVECIEINVGSGYFSKMSM